MANVELVMKVYKAAGLKALQRRWDVTIVDATLIKTVDSEPLVAVLYWEAKNR